MKDFSNIKFNGTFRDYQSKILANANKYLQDGRVHIVAAPGSGKTILGLELIRGLNAPALVLSPSVTIRQQWGERFESNFIPNEESAEGYVSYNLKNPALITSVTYQALHAAYSKSTLKNEADEECLVQDNDEDFSSFDLVKTVKACGIRTICLDEAHHLRSEWQKALEGFIKELGSHIVLISLTATPPYDSTPNEWKRYKDLCGEIDEEIFVPQLVAQKTLCPHQDYIYFNYPTDQETKQLINYNQNAVACTNKIIQSGLVNKAAENCGLINNFATIEETVYENLDSFKALINIVSKSGMRLPAHLLKLIEHNGVVPDFTLSDAEKAFQLILDKPELFSETVSESIRTELSQYSLIDKRKVCLTSNDKINKMLMSSIGKLNSINKIVETEFAQLGDKLRMLILTDYIKKDMLGIIGSDTEISSMGTVPIFESIRRNCNSNTKLAVLSGTLVILPNLILNDVASIADNQQIDMNVNPIENTAYSRVIFSGSNKNKVAVITEAFQKGLINVLIGTKSLLGEGWDSPCINSLILASFVGSFMLSNQMRGRAIRIDKADPEKTSNIWHLVTVEPDELAKKNKVNSIYEITGTDFETLKRRFECFLAPAYSSNVIESGIGRVDIIQPPFNKEGFDRINAAMLAKSTDREAMKESWNTVVRNYAHKQIEEVTEIPVAVQPKGFTFVNTLSLILIAVLFVVFVIAGIFVAKSDISIILKVLLYAVFLLITGIPALKNIKKIKSFSNALNSVKTLTGCLLDTLKVTGDIQSKNSYVDVTQTGTQVLCSLSNATAHEKKVFSIAVSELLSPIDNPRYLLIRNGNYTHSFACPTIIGNKKENAQLLADTLKKKAGDFRVVYTRNENGNKELLKCKKHSYLNMNSKSIKSKKMIK